MDRFIDVVVGGLFISSLIFTACTPRFSMNDYQPGTCIQETSKAYAAGSPGHTHIYKIENYYPEHREYSLSVYTQNDWYYLKKRPSNYFKNNQRFAYQEIKCPDGTESKGLKFRLKGLSLN